MLVMAAVLAVAATLICAVKVLKPEHLTPLVEHFANRAVNADVVVGRVELSFRPAFPVLSLQVDSLSVVSRAYARCSEAELGRLPQWRDSLFSVERFSGAVDVLALFRSGEIALKDVEIVRPAANIVIAGNGIGNFDIYSAADTVADETPIVIPPLSINRFEVVEPREFRYFNAVDSTEATVLMLHDARLENEGRPAYALKIDGNVSGPYIKTYLNLDDFAFGLDGRVRWEPSRPSFVALDNFRVRGGFVGALLSAELAFDSTLVVPSASLAVDPVPVMQLLQLLPDSLRRANRLLAPYFDTPAAIRLDARLLSPFNTAVDSIPAFDFNIAMDDAPLRYGKARFKAVGFDIGASLATGNPDDLKLNIRKMTLSGPTTVLNVEAKATRLLSDPDFSASLRGNIDFSLLPPVLLEKLDGSLRGRVNLGLDVTGRASMFSQARFHLIDARGRFEGRDLCYISSDTAIMFDVPKLNISFGSQEKSRTEEGRKLLGAGLKVDTATILVDGVDIALAGLGLGVGVENGAMPADTTIVIPVGGAIGLRRLNIVSEADSVAMRMRDVGGKVSLRRFNGARRLPEISAGLEIGLLGAGTPSSRFTMRKAHLDVSMHKKPMPEGTRRQVKLIADSIRRIHPDLAPDSVIRLAIEKHRQNLRHAHRRVTSELNDEDNEILEWGIAGGMRKFLLGWQMHGNLSTRSARLFTPLFPLRNRVRRLDVSFSNDSVAVNNLHYKAGRSDLAVTGLVSNIRRALTSRRGNNPLRINFAIESDTIDINQLAEAAFTGAAFAERLRKNDVGTAFSGDDEDELERQLNAMSAEASDSTGPLLIPVNIDGQVAVKAENIFYSNLKMKDLTGDILLYDGGLNLHDLAARTDMGNIRLSALYSAPNVRDMRFGFGLNLERMKIERFLSLVPAVDSLLPLMRDFSGIIDADMAATVDIDSCMDFKLPTLDAAVHLSGDSLVFINPQTYATLGKWLRFKDRNDNKIKHMSVEMLVRDNVLEIFPFSFDIDRYRLGVAGYNDLAMNFDYHISVLKSPLPFKFGVTVKGNPDKYKVRFGGAKYKESRAVENIGVADTARVNLLTQIENVFRRGVRNSKFKRLDVPGSMAGRRLADEPEQVLSAADSLALKREGIIEEPDSTKTQ